MASLSVNINKIATLRNARGGNVPNVLQVALDIVSFGAHGITVHPRPDGRHIRHHDVYDLKRALTVEFNIEGYPSDEFLAMVADVEPAQCTLVPDPPDVITSNAGWLVQMNTGILERAVGKLKEKNIRVSVFIDPLTASPADYDILRKVGVDRIELYTERYARAYPTPERSTVLASYRRAADDALRSGLGINAGHDLNLKNLPTLMQEIPSIAEVSIGHELISDALYLGLKETVRAYIAAATVMPSAQRVGHPPRN